jgi:hypothetical protein
MNEATNARTTGVGRNPEAIVANEDAKEEELVVPLSTLLPSSMKR